MTKTEQNALLNLCARIWIEYCGISISCRTLYWDIAMRICDDYKIFENCILSYDYGEESLEYDTCLEFNQIFYNNIKEIVVEHLTADEKILFLKGFSVLTSDIEN